LPETIILGLFQQVPFFAFTFTFTFTILAAAAALLEPGGGFLLVLRFVLRLALVEVDVVVLRKDAARRGR